MRITLRIPLLIVLALSASACASMPSFPGIRDEIAARPGLTAQQRLDLAVARLNAGSPQGAKVELEAALAEHPNDAAARRLLSQIDADPRTLLGERNYAYVAKEGDTMTSLAERYLGDRLWFYALARYNDMDAPNALRAGQTIMIPERRRTTTTASTTPRTPPQTASAIPPVVPRGDPTRANQLRLQALELLNTGSVDRAVVLLQQARALDGGNAAIQRDLDRATRIQGSLRASN